MTRGDTMTDILGRLAETIEQRRVAPQEKSYTASLFAAGREKCAEKFGEEAVETVIALVKGDKRAITHEAADVLYHLLVALNVSGVSLDDVAWRT